MQRTRSRSTTSPRPRSLTDLAKRSPLWLLASCLLSATVAPAAAQESVLPLKPAVDLAPSPSVIEASPNPEAEGDAPALLDDRSVESFADLARQLSARSDWLVPQTLEALSHSALRIDEVFPATPPYLAIDGKAYQIRIEPFGPQALDLDPTTDPWFVFLTPEVYDDLGEDRFLAFQDGARTVLSSQDLEKLPNLGLTLAGLAETDSPLAGEVLASPETRFELSDFAFELKRSARMLAAGGQIELKNTCDPVAPVSCTNAQPVCGLAGYSPYFVLESILIKVNHEIGRQRPEIELYPLQPDSSAGLGPGIETQMIFDGRFARDFAGRWRYLPDINNLNTHHTITHGFALFPTDVAADWAALLVEDDKTAGKLEVKDTVETVVKLFTSASSFVKSIKTMDYFKLLKASYDLVRLALNINGDDCFEETLALNRSLFCFEGSASFTLDTDEWALRGHFACIETACVPPPPLEASISGPSALDPWQIGHFTCTASHGDPPYTYTWHKGYGTTGPVVGTQTTSATSHSIGLADTVDFQVTCALSDNAGDSASAVKGVVVEDNSGGCDPVECNDLCGGLGECGPNDMCICI